jgi:Flp pilus assembly protein CpaB
MDVSQARRAVKASWINARTVLGLLLFALAFIGAQRILAEAESTVTVWAAARDLGGGTSLTSDDLVAADVKLPGDLLALYAQTSRALEGVILDTSVRAGELIPASSIEEVSSSPGRSMTIPVTPEHAIGGALRPGDRVDVFATFNPGDVRARTSLLVGDVEVLSIVTSGGLVSGDESAVGVTVDVIPEDAARLAFAIRNAEIDLARITGASVTGAAESVGIEDFE